MFLPYFETNRVEKNKLKFKSLQEILDEEELKELRSKVIHLETELMLEEQKVNHWKQRYIGLLISGLEAHEIEDYVDELENVD
tara:strand:+ start:1181 stop:1429 length:249 start_codon:yes stop_codon:yes gene_type:complete